MFFGSFHAVVMLYDISPKIYTKIVSLDSLIFCCLIPLWREPGANPTKILIAFIVDIAKNCTTAAYTV